MLHRTLLDTLLSLQPQQSVASGESQEDKVKILKNNTCTHVHTYSVHVHSCSTCIVHGVYTCMTLCCVCTLFCLCVGVESCC